MEDGGTDVEEKPIGRLVGRLIDESKGYARAELGLARARAEAKAMDVKVPALILAAAFLFLIAAVITLCMTIALALATLIGPLAGGLVATFIALATAGGLALVAKRKLDRCK
ncbi:MAG TPA: phage holin family protein [Sphingomicrobium sp.]|nr:phage holin family protein [Sphingomicrobium sp.]